ncbi:MAG: hypothetical protein HY055_01460 [Magnetospirillum sp.]|nr:hypothetical protein [Magnetospirillum sp.]
MINLVGIALVLCGLGLSGAALISDAGELQALMGIFATAGLLIALVGGALMALGALFGRGGQAKAGCSGLSPEQQQLLDAREFQATRRGD